MSHNVHHPFTVAMSSITRFSRSLWMPVCVSVMFCWSYTAAESTTMSLLSQLCTPEVCRNGECYLSGFNTHCTCGLLYSGQLCEHVVIDQIRLATIGDSVILQWSMPPRLKNYKVVYYETMNPHSIMYTKDISMSDNEMSLLISGLKPGRTHYRMCIEDDVTADLAVSVHAFDMLTHCIEVQTSAQYDTLFAWFLAFMLFGVVILLVYGQRQKIQILYFGGQHFLDKVHNDTYNMEINMNHKTTSLNSVRDTHNGSKRGSLAMAQHQRIT